MRKKLLLLIGLFFCYFLGYSQEYIMIEGITVDQTEEEFVANEIIHTPNNPENEVTINIGDENVVFKAGYKIKLKPGFTAKPSNENSTGTCSFRIDDNLRLNLSNEEFIIGAWREPQISPNWTSDALQDSLMIEVKRAYFNLLTGMHNISSVEHQDFEHNKHYLKFASRNGLKYMVIDTTYKGLSYINEDGETILNTYRPEHFRIYEDREEERNEMINNYKNNISQEERDAMYAYTLGDEPEPEFNLNLQKWIRFINNWEKEKLTYVNFYPSYHDDIKTEGFEDYLRYYLDNSDSINNVDVFSFDHYPYRDRNPDPHDFSTTYFFDHKIANKVSIEENKPFWGVPCLQQIEGGWLEPLEQHIRLTSFVPIAYNAKGLLMYYYHGTMDLYSLADIVPDSIRTYHEKRYEQVQNINHYIRDIIEPVIMNSYYLGYWHQDNSYLNEGHDFDANELINENTPLVDSCSSIDLMISIFKTNSILDTSNTNYSLNNYYILLQNKSTATIYNSKVYFNGDFRNRILLSPRVGDITPEDNGPNAGQVTPYHTLAHKYYFLKDDITYIDSLNISFLNIEHMRGGEARFIRIIKESEPEQASASAQTEDSDGDTVNRREIESNNFELDQSKIKIFPNPNNGLFNVYIPHNTSKLKVEVFNLAGQAIYNDYIEKEYFQLDISNENTGVYFVRISTNNQFYYSKILKIK